MERNCAALARPDIWGVFKSRLLEPAFDRSKPVPYERLVEKFGFATPAAASNSLVTAKRMFLRSLRSVIGEYELDDAAIDAEIVDLRRIVSQFGA
jgi:hypothetical protein